MKKLTIIKFVVVFFILVSIGFIIYFNLTYKTREEKWDENILALEFVEKDYDDSSFLMSIIYKNDVTDEGIVLEGKVLRGSVSVNDKVQLIGISNNKEVTITKILDDSNNSVTTANEEDRINVTIKGISDKAIKPGQVLAKSQTIEAYNQFIAEVYILSEEEGGIDKSFKKNDFLDFYIRTSSFTGKILDIKETSKVKPGMAATIKVKLNSKVAIEEKTTFVVRYDSQTMGAGQITKVIK